MDPTTLTILALGAASKAGKRQARTVKTEDAYYAAHGGDWIDVLANFNRLTSSVERELRQMTTAKGWARVW
jgi:hypothetical protein